MAESKGVWIDKETGKVVNSPPHRGRLIVSSGSDLPKDKIDELVERYTADVETAAAPDNTEKAVTTKTAAAKK